jgi:diguanylate cyclase
MIEKDGSMKDNLQVANILSIIDNVSDIIMSFDAEGKLTYVNKAWTAALGYTERDLKSLTIWSIIIPEFMEGFKNAYQSILSVGGVKMLRLALMSKSGKALMAEGKVYAGLDDNGNVTEASWILKELSISDDLLELYQKDKSLMDFYVSQSDTAYSIMMLDEPVDWNDTVDKDAVLDFVFTHDRVVLVNKAYLKLYNIQDENDVINKTPADLFTFDISGGKTAWKALLDSSHQSFKAYELTPGVWAEGYNKSIYNEAGQFCGHVTSMWAVSNDKEAYNLAAQDQLMGRISDFRFMRSIDGATSFPYVGSEFYEITGLTLNEIKNDSKPLENLINPADIERVKAAVLNSQKNMSFMEFEFRLSYPARGLRWIKVIAHPERLPDVGVCWQGYLSDITERKQSEEWIEFLNTALMNIYDSVIITGTYGDIIYANKSAVSLFGYTQKELIGKKPDIFVAEQASEEAVADMINTLAEGKTYVIEALSKKKDGTLFMSENSTTTIFDENKAVKAYVLIQRDITERMNILEALRNSNERFEQMTKQSRAIAWEIDEDYLITYVSNAVLDVLGYTPEEVIGCVHIQELLYPQQKQEYKEKVTEAFKAKKNYYNLTSQVLTKSGKTLYLSTNGMSIFNTENSFKGYHGLSLDITEKVEMEQIINTEKERFRTTLLSVGDGVISTDGQGYIDVMNPVAENLTGWTQKKAISKTLDEVFNVVDELSGRPYPNPAKKVLATAEKEKNVDPILLISKTGVETPIGSSAAPIKNQNGDMTGAVIVFRDFTEFRERQKQIEFLSFHDPLTGLYNRRYMEETIRRMDTKRNLPIAVMVLDVNGLKLTNDAFGHSMGDNLLKAVADVITSVCRADDVVARMGGDEFTILLPRTDETKAERIKQRIIKASAKAKLDSIVVSMAAGYSIKTKVNEAIELTIVNADNQMYREKRKFGKTMRSQTIETVLRNINYKYDSEQLHTERVSQYCEAIATAMNLSEKEITEIKIAGSLHDIGKIMVPPELLNKPGKLTNDEYEIIKKHPETGYQILKAVDEYACLSEFILYHHERWDGHGYPAGLKQEEIPLQARMIAVADAYEAMTAKRPYQKIRTTEEAKAELKRCSGTQFDPKIVEIFLKLV